MPDRRFLTTLVALIAVSGALAGASVAALRQRGDAGEWSRRALAAEVELVQVRADLETATKELAERASEQEQLLERVDELANDVAQAGDDTAVSELQRDSYRRIAQAYADVTEKWQSCVRGYAQLRTVLENPRKYDAADTRRFTTELETLCKQAQQADDALREQLSR